MERSGRRGADQCPSKLSAQQLEPLPSAGFLEEQLAESSLGRAVVRGFCSKYDLVDLYVPSNPEISLQKWQILFLLKIMKTSLKMP